MHGSVVRLIAGKELRDLIRDRRTVMLIIVLPAVLYPLFGVTGLLFATSLKDKPSTIGVVGIEHLPPATPLLVGDKLAPGFTAKADGELPIVLKASTDEPDELLRTRQADAVIVIPREFAGDLEHFDRKPTIVIKGRDGDDRSKIAVKQATLLVRAYEGKLREKRFEAKGLPKDFDHIVIVQDPQSAKNLEKKTADELRDTFARIFPFILMMWLVAGAIHPAVDMTAGEKERGTMETLLISPAERSEIVLGKFFATSAFAFASVVWNVLWLTGGALLLESVLGYPIVSLPGLLACVVLGLPLAMLFSAVCVALGIVARSTKEGQYYLMPIILITMPLAFFSMMPGTELNASTCWIPVTGAMLLQQKMLSVTPDPTPWEYFPPVLGSLAVWIAIALALAVRQFNREEVLFRETGAKPRGFLRGLFKRS